MVTPPSHWKGMLTTCFTTDIWNYCSNVLTSQPTEHQSHKSLSSLPSNCHVRPQDAVVLHASIGHLSQPSQYQQPLSLAGMGIVSSSGTPGQVWVNRQLQVKSSTWAIQVDDRSKAGILTGWRLQLPCDCQVSETERVLGVSSSSCISSFCICVYE